MATCSKHTGQPYVMVCHSCDRRYQFVCCECIAKNHKGHDLKTFETAANDVLSGLRKEKANISPTLKEIHVELKNYATIEENERNISEKTRQYINRRRELLKLAVDEAAEILLEKQESSYKRIVDVLLCGKQQAEDKVRNFLEFQSKLAMLEHSTDYQHVIKMGKQMYFPNISSSHCPIPAGTRHTLRHKATVDRRLVRELFGEEHEEEIGRSYILHCFDELEDSDTDSVFTTELFANESEQVVDVIDSQVAESDGDVCSTGRPPNVLQKFQVLGTSTSARSALETPNWNSTLQSPQYQTRYQVSSTTIYQSEQGRQNTTERRVFGEKTSLFPHSIAPESRSPPNQNFASQTNVNGLQRKYGGRTTTPHRRSDITNNTRLFSETNVYPRKDGYL